MLPEQQLYHAVMRQAVVDLVGGTREDESCADLIRKDTIAFFTDRVGRWADMRAEVCEAIDRDPDEVRAAIIVFLEGCALPDLGRVRAANFEKSRALWRTKKARDATAEAYGAQQAAKRKRAAPKPAPVIVRRKCVPPSSTVPVAPEPSPAKRPLIKPSRRAAKPWLCPPRSPEDDFWYGIAPSA